MSKKVVPQSMEAVPDLAGELRQLQEANQELEEAIKLQLQFLGIHMQVAIAHTPFLDPLLFARIQQEQSIVHEQHSKRLLASQIRVQEEREMGELVKSYEGRIADLRAALTGKEAEIAEATQDEGSDTLPKRENLRKLNLQCIQKHSIHKALQELKKISVESDALEHCIRQSKSNQNVLKKGKAVAVVKPQPASLTFKEKIDRMQQDKLLMRVYELLAAEVAREGELKHELGSLREDWEKTSKTHRQLLKKYKRQGTSNMPARQNYCENGNHGLNFLEELERVEGHPVNENGLFHRVDLNVERQKVKGERRHERERAKASKEN